MNLRHGLVACALIAVFAVVAHAQCGANGTVACNNPRNNAAVVPPPNFAPATENTSGPVLPPVNPTPLVSAPVVAPVVAGGTSASASASTGGGGVMLQGVAPAMAMHTYQMPVTTYQTYQVPTTSYQTYQVPMTTMASYQVPVAAAPVASTAVTVSAPTTAVAVEALPTNVAIPATTVAGCSSGSCGRKGLLGGGGGIRRPHSRSRSVAVTRS